MKEVQLNQPDQTKELRLQDIYIPLGDSLVFEFEITTRTKAGVELPDQLLKKYAQEQSIAKKVLTIGPEVKSVKIGDYILINPVGRITQIPLIYKNETGLQHGQIHEYDVLGIVDKYFAQFPSKENTIN